MRTVVQVITTGNGSMRDRVVNDQKLSEFDLVVSQHKNKKRPNGWAKLHMRGSPGALNLQWHANANALICWTVTRNGNKPHDIICSFIRFLLARLSKHIISIHVDPP